MGIFLSCPDALFLYAMTSNVTSDCLIDSLIDWWETVRVRFSHIKMLRKKESQSAYPVYAARAGMCGAVVGHGLSGLLATAIPSNGVGDWRAALA